MKKSFSFLTLLLVIGSLIPALAQHEGHKHDKAIPGPKGGKVLEVGVLHAEFFVEKDRKVRVTFYDEAMRPVAPAEQIVTAVAEAPAGKAKLEFAKEGDGLLSSAALPAGDGYNVVLQIKPKADAKPQNFRIALKLEVCPTCKLSEYACVCEEGKDGHHH